MFTPTLLVRIISDAQDDLGMNPLEFAKKSGISDSHWRSIRTGRRKLYLEVFLDLAKAVKLSFQLFAPHQEPFLQLTQDEADSLLKLAEHYKQNGPKHPHILRTAVEKLTGK